MRLIFTLFLCGLCFAQSDPSTVLEDSPRFVARRSGRFVIVELLTPHRVISTSAATGGQSDQLRYLVNHQSMEPAGDIVRHDKIVALTEEQYHQTVAQELKLEPEKMASMGTAANMHYLGRRKVEFRDLRVDAFVTAGVEGNAVRPGDPANWYEGPKGMEYVRPNKGTINIILLINQPLTAAAHARAITTLTEAKTAALLELAVPSRYSSHLATGTSTDQFIVAAPLSRDRLLRWTGPDTKLGELIGTAVREATKDALRWQNGLESSYARGFTTALGRFGLTEPEFLKRLKELLPAPQFELLQKNQMGVLMEPRLSAAAFAYAAVLDRLQYGSIPSELAAEVLRDQGATVAVALSTKSAQWQRFWQSIPEAKVDRLDPFVRGVALGWQAKWDNEQSSLPTR